MRRCCDASMFPCPCCRRRDSQTSGLSGPGEHGQGEDGEEEEDAEEGPDDDAPPLTLLVRDLVSCSSLACTTACALSKSTGPKLAPLTLASDPALFPIHCSQLTACRVFSHFAASDPPFFCRAMDVCLMTMKTVSK